MGPDGVSGRPPSPITCLISGYIRMAAAFPAPGHRSTMAPGRRVPSLREVRTMCLAMEVLNVGRHGQPAAPARRRGGAVPCQTAHSSEALAPADCPTGLGRTGTSSPDGSRTEPVRLKTRCARSGSGRRRNVRSGRCVTASPIGRFLLSDHADVPSLFPSAFLNLCFALQAQPRRSGPSGPRGWPAWFPPPSCAGEALSQLPWGPRPARGRGGRPDRRR